MFVLSVGRQSGRNRREDPKTQGNSGGLVQTFNVAKTQRSVCREKKVSGVRGARLAITKQLPGLLPVHADLTQGDIYHSELHRFEV